MVPRRASADAMPMTMFRDAQGTKLPLTASCFTACGAEPKLEPKCSRHSKQNGPSLREMAASELGEGLGPRKLELESMGLSLKVKGMGGGEGGVPRDSNIP